MISMLAKSLVVAAMLLGAGAHIQTHIPGSSSVQEAHVYARDMSINLASIVSVLDFGAKGDGSTDNTQAFQTALDSLQPLGGVVFVPAGNYSFSGSLSIPTATSLVGTYQSVPSHEVDQSATFPDDGSVLLPRGGRGSENGTAFLTINENAVLKGFTIYYPDQLPNIAPLPYPWTITLNGNNPAVIDVELLNCWNGIQAVHAARHYIARVQGQPSNIGIYVDQTYDIGRIENVHWNPWYSTNALYIAHQTTQGVGFIFARTDWEYVLNTFVFAMSIGYRFIDSPDGSCNGNFVGIGADCCQNASVWVDSADPWGVLITNGEFTSFAGSFGPDVGLHTQVVITNSNTGSVRFVNSAFWGPSNQIAWSNSSGTLSFDSCIFNVWDTKKLGQAAIQVDNGNLQVRGCEFQTPGVQLMIANNAKKVIFSDNIISGPLNITQTNGAKLANANNLAD